MKQMFIFEFCIVAKPYQTVSSALCYQVISHSDFCVVLPSHNRQCVLYCVAKPHQTVSFVLCCQATSHSFVLCCKATTDSEFCVVLPRHIRQWVLLCMFELLQCFGGRQNSDVCYEGKIILFWNIYLSDCTVCLWEKNLCCLWVPVSVSCCIVRGSSGWRK
jgi:hypothetical protein